MNITNHSVVSIHYTLKGEDGSVIDSSSGREPLQYLHGAGNIIPGLENELTGCAVGDSKLVVVQPKDGYGEKNPELIQKLPPDAFNNIENVQVGMKLQAQSASGEARSVVVSEIEEDGVTIDANHILAGEILNFDVKVESVREATEEEIEQGHV